ncbi:hypothetical protein JNUCC64_17835 [Streptomyces sp. JNUCC 64]
MSDDSDRSDRSVGSLLDEVANWGGLAAALFLLALGIDGYLDGEGPAFLLLALAMVATSVFAFGLHRRGRRADGDRA